MIGKYFNVFSQSNTVIEKIDLEGNSIRGEGASYIARVLKDNLYVTNLVGRKLHYGQTTLKIVTWWV